MQILENTSRNFGWVSHESGHNIVRALKFSPWNSINNIFRLNALFWMTFQEISLVPASKIMKKSEIDKQSDMVSIRTLMDSNLSPKERATKIVICFDRQPWITVRDFFIWTAISILNREKVLNFSSKSPKSNLVRVKIRYQWSGLLKR